MAQARNYAEWAQAAQVADRISGREAWRDEEASARYDHRTIRFRLDELREVKASGDPHHLVFYLHEGVHGNMGGMGQSALYGHARFGTKRLISEYIEELATAIEDVAAIDEEIIGFAEKRALFDRVSHCFGQSALMFSGAGSLGPFHLGVARALADQGLLPTVLSGASAGAFVCAVIGTRTEDELDDYLFSEDLYHPYASISTKSRIGQQMKVDLLVSLVEDLVPDLTFEEAFELTGRKINISVSPNEPYQRSRLLNAVTSPNVMIREAVMASCAIPGIFPAVTLAARSVDGQREPYIRSRQWVDGSVTDDQPADRLMRLYGVNHFISSQANPIVRWALRDVGWQESTAGRLLDAYRVAWREWNRATYPLAAAATKNLYPLNLMTRLGYSVATQDYTADVNILPRRRFWNPTKLLAVLTEREIRELVSEGERSTWPKVELIRNCTLISRTLERVLGDLNERVDGLAVPRRNADELVLEEALA